jgi:hypothetical protein
VAELQLNGAASQGYRFLKLRFTLLKHLGPHHAQMTHQRGEGAGILALRLAAGGGV